MISKAGVTPKAATKVQLVANFLGTIIAIAILGSLGAKWLIQWDAVVGWITTIATVFGGVVCLFMCIEKVGIFRDTATTPTTTDVVLPRGVVLPCAWCGAKPREGYCGVECVTWDCVMHGRSVRVDKWNTRTCMVSLVPDALNKTKP